MLNTILTTPIDDLVDLVKLNNNCKISFLQKKLNLSLDVIEKWLVILEEYKIIKVKYSGFDGYVSLVEEKIESSLENEINIDNLKSTFLDKCYNNKLPTKKIEELWNLFIEQKESEIKELFVKRAKLKHYKNIQIKSAWEKYLKDLKSL